MANRLKPSEFIPNQQKPLETTQKQPKTTCNNGTPCAFRLVEILHVGNLVCILFKFSERIGIFQLNFPAMIRISTETF